MVERRNEYGFVEQSIVDPDELVLLDALRQRLRQFPALLDWWQRLSRAEWLADCEMRLDDEFTAWRHLSSGVRYSLDLAADNLRVLDRMLGESAADPMPFVAMYPLARSALEGAATALWIIGPDDPRERVARHLRNAARELKEEATLRKFAMETASTNREELGFTGSYLGKMQGEYRPWYRKHAAQIADCATRLGIPDPTHSPHIGYGTVVAEATAITKMPPHYGEVLWRQISGLTHPSLMRATSTLNMGDQGENGDGTVHVMMSSKLGTVFSGVMAALLLFKSGLAAYAVRIEQKGNRTQYAR